MVMRVVKALVLGALLASSSAAIAGTADRAARGEARLAQIVEGRVAGQPVDCIDLSRIDSSEIVDGTAIVYHVGNRLYVNRPEIGGSWLDDDDILLTRSWSSDLCRIDTVQLIDRGSRFERGFVGLGQFVPYTKPKKSQAGGAGPAQAASASS
jgi:hypothetical protein